MWKVHYYQSPLYCSIIYKKASDSKSNYKLGQCVNLFEMFYYYRIWYFLFIIITMMYREEDWIEMVFLITLSFLKTLKLMWKT